MKKESNLVPHICCYNLPLILRFASMQNHTYKCFIYKLPGEASSFCFLNCCRQNKVEPGYVQVVWLNQLLKLTASSQTAYLAQPPTSPAVPQCPAICVCAVCSFSSSYFTCLGCPPSPFLALLQGWLLRTAAARKDGIKAWHPSNCNKCISSGKSPPSPPTLLDFRIRVLNCIMLLFKIIIIMKNQPKLLAV